MAPRSQLAAGLFCAALAGREPDEGCTLVLVPGIAVEVRDRITNEFLATTPRGVVVEGASVDSLVVSGFSDHVPPRVTTFHGARERAGRYVVRIEADGYAPWDTAGIRVTEDDCHVRTVRFTAELEPLPQEYGVGGRRIAEGRTGNWGCGCLPGTQRRGRTPVSTSSARAGSVGIQLPHLSLPQAGASKHLVSKPTRSTLEYKGVQIGKGYVVDLLGEDSLIVEIKSVKRLLPIHSSQVMTYMRLQNIFWSRDQLQRSHAT